MTHKTVYIETSVVSYLTARPSSHLMAAARQKATVDWWDTQRARFALCISQVVTEEARRGDPAAAQRRLEVLRGIPTIDISDAAVALARRLIDGGAIPPSALNDALHVAVSAAHGIEYLLTWNYRHIDNAEMKPLMRDICKSVGCVCPEICTPQELMGVSEDGR